MVQLFASFYSRISIGSNKESFPIFQLGVTAIIITAFALAGSIVLSIVVNRIFFRSSKTSMEKKYERKPHHSGFFCCRHHAWPAFMGSGIIIKHNPGIYAYMF